MSFCQIRGVLHIHLYCRVIDFSFLLSFLSTHAHPVEILLQDYLSDDVTLLVDTGDAQFNAMKLKLPEKAGYAAASWVLGLFKPQKFIKAQRHVRCSQCVWSGPPVWSGPHNDLAPT